MIFPILLAAAAVIGGCLGACISHVPGKRGPAWLRFLLLAPAGLLLFAGGLCLWARSTDYTAIVNRFFPDRLSKLLGSGILLGILCLLGVVLGALRARGLRNYFRAVSGSRLHRWTGLAVLAGAAGLVVGALLLSGDPHPSPLRLSEVCCGNFSLRADPDTGEYEDYIEIVNTGGETVNLEGYFLSDNGKKRSRFRLPALELEPGACLVLWPDGTGKSGKKTGEAIHLNFQLQEGETLWFSSPYGVVLDYVTVPKPEKDVSLCRIDGAWVRAKGTPGWSNENAAVLPPITLEAPQLSLRSGFYAEPQTLTITAPPGCEIRYTLDGAVPTENSLLYEGPLTLEDISAQPNRVLNHPTTTLDRSGVITEPVDKGTLIRAVALDGSGARSETVTAVYFVGEETFRKYEGQTVVNIVSAPNDLFGNYGIAVTGLEYDKWLESGGKGDAPFPFFYRRGRLLEKEAQVFLWDGDHRLLMQDPCGIRLQGDHTRAAVYKRFRLISRPIYSGSYAFSVPVFGDWPSHSFFTRQDSADVVPQMLCEGLGLGGLEAVPAAVFLNGEFYYTTFLRERYDKQYFETHFDVDRDDLILISNDKLEEGREEDYADYQDLMAFIRDSDCADPAVYAEICRRMDVENYAMYVAMNIYCNNTDWSIYKNYKLWRTRKPLDGESRDGRWRWLLYDMDGCVWSSEKYGAHKAEFNAFEVLQPYTEVPFGEMPLFSDLKENESFRQLFARTWLDLMNAALTPARAGAVLDRYGITDDTFWEIFLTDRPHYGLRIVTREMGLTGKAAALRLNLSDPAAGGVRMETGALDFADGAWEGSWITGVPLTLTAEPAEGWRFVRWEGSASGTEAVITLTPDSDTALTAVFAHE